MKNLKYYLSFLLGLLIVMDLWGQDVWEKPEPFDGIKYDAIGQRYYFEGNPYAEYKKLPTNKTIKRRKWNVITSRAATPILDSPDGSQKTSVDFSTFFFVRDESGDYLEVTEGRSEPSLGWCHKDHLILWNTPLVDHTTGIELKSFMVNNFIGVENLKLIRKDQEFYQVYDGPGEDAKKIEARLIYDVFFVFKYENKSGEKGKGRYLVSPYYDLNVTSPLLGWVEEGRTEVWKTALCLEPNFAENALKERSTKDIIATVFTDGFGGADQIEEYRKTGAKGSALVGGKLRDPALGDYELQPRMDGEIFRYPVFNGYRDQNNTKISTAVTGKTNLGNSGVVEGFDDVAYTQISKKSKELAENMKFRNVVFLLDGSNGTQRYINLVRDFLNKAYEDNVARGVNTIKYGAVLYKNEFNDNSFKDNPESEFCKVYPLTTNAKDLAEQLGGYPTGENGFKKESEAVYYAMKKAVKTLVPNQSNSIIHIGNAPDNAALDPFFKSKKQETMLSPNDLGQLLKTDNIDMNYINFIGFSTEVRKSTRKLFFENQQDEILPELALAQANKYFGVNFAIAGKQPETPVLNKYYTQGAEVASMSKSAFQIKSYFLDDYNERLVADYLQQELDSCNLRTEEFLGDLKEIVEDESALTDRAGDFEMPILALVIDQLLENDANNTEFLKEFKEWAAAEKVQLFVKSNTYYKCDKLEHPLFKYVLFMHRSKLDAKIREVQRIANVIQTGDGRAEAVDALGNYWSGLAETVLGGDKKYNDVTIEELRKKLLGVENMNLMMPNDLEKFGGLTIKDVLKSRKLSDEQIDAMLNYFTDANEKLKAIYNGTTYYEIEGTTTKFYWVPLEYVFG